MGKSSKDRGGRSAPCRFLRLKSGKRKNPVAWEGFGGASPQNLKGRMIQKRKNQPVGGGSKEV